LKEDKGDKFKISFYCLAEDEDHAEEQAYSAYPNGEDANAVQVERSEYPFPLHDSHF
jgi:hypothetical protein